MIASLLNGCALVIDDEIDNPKSSVSKILAILETEGTLFIKLKDLPADNARANLSGISYIILDWDIRSEAQSGLPESIQLGEALGNVRLNDNMTFIKDMLKAYFIPIFIFSKQNIENIEIKLKSDTEINQAFERRVFIKNKSELTGKKVKSYLTNWLKKNRTVFALKMFEEQLNQSKNDFLVEVGGLDSEWANIVYNIIKIDHIGDDEEPIQYLLNLEFREFLTNSLLGRMNNIDFDMVKFLKKPQNIPNDHIGKIFESIKFYRYSDDIDNGQAYEGDIYQRYENEQSKNLYLLNINAVCDIRKNKMLLLQGKTKDKFRISNVAFYSLPCFAQKASIEFRFDDRYRIDKPDDLSTILIEEKDKQGIIKTFTYRRIGRLIHPYITAIRSEFAHFIARQGIPRHPT